MSGRRGYGRIYANKDAWQFNQYLKGEVEVGRSVADMRVEIAKREMSLRDAELELGRALNALLSWQDWAAPHQQCHMCGGDTPLNR